MNALLMDIGNSRLKWGVLDRGQIRRTGHISLDRVRDTGLSALTSKLPREVDAVIASNVAGASFATRISGVVGIHCGCDVHFVHTERAACGVTNSYRQPRRMGVDRWVAMIGAWSEAERACLVVDAGTAVTIDALDDAGQHLGGQILPGVTLMADALSARTSDIPATRRATPKPSSGLGMFASNTAGAVAHGACNAVVGAVERAVAAMRAEQLEAEVFLTGGDASRILKSLGTEPIHRPHLVLQGLARLLESRR
jgi:type III pantothenate kinase